jgi:hypothetical protein
METMVSKYISLKEVSKSNTASKKGIDNTPKGSQLENIKKLCINVIDPLREWKGEPLYVSSCFRSDALNKVTPGSSKTSQHCAYNGAAMDIDDVGGKITNKQMFEFIKLHLDFDQLIYEFGDNNNPDWVHVSYVSKEKNRKQVLRATSVDGEPSYSNY